ncbi:MAG: ABC transporter permease [Bacteroidales bacterium]|nr:ABC transporter permease [Bacteroidales bacterium]
MSFERFIADRFMPRKGAAGSFSGPLTAIAVASIALGVLVMVMAISILRGFQADIRGKVVGFGGHIAVASYGSARAYEELPIEADSLLVANLQATEGISHVQRVASIGGMAKTDDQIYGLLLRGLGSEADTTFLAASLVEGHLPAFGQGGGEVMVSTTIASRLRLGVGERLRTYFWQGETYRSRAFTICGLYNTDLADMDELYIVGDLAQVQRLHGWSDQQVGGLELTVADFSTLDATTQRVAYQLPFDMKVETIVGRNPALFSWLDLLNANITLILGLMCIVCVVAIVSALLIMIFEKSATIGLLKALGTTSASLRRIFLIKAARIIALGVAIGDVAGLLLSFVQLRYHLLALNPESYSMSHVPVEINLWVYLAISLGTIAVCLLALLLPTAYISRISPARTMRIEN